MGINEQTTLTGRISYISDKDADRGREHGSERFTITRRADNHMVQRAHCRIVDAPHVERDSVLAVDATMRPTDAYVRIETQGSFTGLAWYRFSEARAECEAFTREQGRQHYQETVTSEPFPFCCHALVGDAWMLAGVAPGRDGQRQAVRLLTSTLNKQGATGPALATKAYGVERVGLETIVVPAGTFATLHLRSGEVAAPELLATADFSYDIWVTDDKYRLAVLSMYKGKSRYQLTELRRSHN